MRPLQIESLFCPLTWANLLYLTPLISCDTDIRPSIWCRAYRSSWTATSLSQLTYLLTCIDRFTRWPEAIPLTSIAAEAVSHTFLTGWIARSECLQPTVVLTDTFIWLSLQFRQSTCSVIWHKWHPIIFVCVSVPAVASSPCILHSVLVESICTPF